MILLLAIVAASGLGDTLTSDMNFTSKPESVVGAELLDARMGEGPAPITESVIVRSETITVDDPAFQAVVEATTADLAALDGIIASASNYYQATAAGLEQAEAMVSADRHTTLILVTFVGDFADAMENVVPYHDAIAPHNGGDFQVLPIGNVTGNYEVNGILSRDLAKAEMLGLPAAILVLIVVFGALVAAGIPLILALVSIAVALGLTALVGRAMDLSTFVINMITMIGLAVGIDYALFIVSRYREERQFGLSKLEAISTAGGTASKAVLFSGFTVVVALSGMLIMPTTLFHSLGIGAILVVIVAVGAMLTLVPAILSLLGDRIDWPRRRRATSTDPDALDRQTAHRGFWGRVTYSVTARPIISLVLAAGLLLVAAVPYVDLKSGQTGIETLPEGNVKTAYEILERDFSAGTLAPLVFVVDAPRTADIEQRVDRLVQTVTTDADFVPAPNVTWNDAGDLARVRIPLAVAANSDAAHAVVERVRSDIVPGAFDGSGARVYITGGPAYDVDFLGVIDRYTPIVFAFVLGLSFILLMLAFRSIVVPLKAIAMNLLSVGAAYGLMVAVFQKDIGRNILGFHHSPVIEAWVPIFLFCVLFGLSMDYHVFLLSRIREHYDLTHRNRESVAVGLQTTGRLITGAALIMVVVFSAFALGEMVVFQQLGFGLAVAILLDATIVRSVLVPASMALLGDWNWYLPRWLRWLPDLRVEGSAAHAAHTASGAAATVDLDALALGDAD